MLESPVWPPRLGGRQTKSCIYKWIIVILQILEKKNIMNNQHKITLHPGVFDPSETVSYFQYCVNKIPAKDMTMESSLATTGVTKWGIAKINVVQNRSSVALPLNRGGNWPIENKNSYISGTECPIDLKPGCKFKFVRCLETYLRTSPILGHEGTLQGPFLGRVPWN